MLTKGNFNRDERSHLLRLFNFIMNFSMFSCSHFSLIHNSQQTMTKGLMQEENQEKRNVWLRNQKLMMSSVSKTAHQSPVALGSSASHSPETLEAHSFELGLHRYGETRSERFEWKHSIEFSSVAFGCKYDHLYGETHGGNDKENHWCWVISPQLEDIRCWPSWEAFSTVRHNLSRQPEDNVVEIDVNAMIWEYLCQQRWKQRYILDKIIKRLYVPPRTRTSIRSNNCSTFHRNWSRIKAKTYWGYLQE